MAGGHLARFFAGLVFTWSVVSTSFAWGELQLTFIDGKTVNVESLTIAATGKLSAPGLPTEATLDDLATIVVAGVSIIPPKSAVAIELRPQGRLQVHDLEYADEKLILKWGERTVRLGLEPVAAIRFDPTAKNEVFDKILATPIPDLDTIFFVSEEKKTESLKGLVESLSKNDLVFSWENQTRKLDRNTVWGIVFAGTNLPQRLPPVTAILRDGSQLTGKIRQADEQQVNFELEGNTLDFPWTDIARMEFRSSRVMFLSDLKPVEEEHRPLLAQPRPWQRDKSSLGKPLRLGEKAFTKGLGTHSYTKLTFDAEGKFDQLTGIVGLDPAGFGKGDCVLTVQGDGSPLFTQRLRGKDPPIDLQVKIRGIKQVTLIVEPGEGLDLADFVNWCDLRFLRTSERGVKP